MSDWADDKASELITKIQIDHSLGGLRKAEIAIAAALRAAAEQEREQCAKIAEMYVLGEEVNLMDPMAVRQDQIASNIVNAIRAIRARA